MNISLSAAAAFVRGKDNFTILCHANPDGDTLGSAYALCGALQLMGKKARVICPEKASPRFDYLLNGVKNQTVSEQDETVISVDIADTELMGGFKEQYGGRVELCVDHHVSNKFYAEKTLLDSDASACAVVIWELIKELGVTPTNEIAAAVYTGISTDTGCYRYANTTAKAHTITAELMRYDFGMERINYVMFEMKTRERVNLEQSAYSTIEYYFGGKCAIITLSEEMLSGIDIEDANNVSSLPRQIKGVEAGVVLKEKSSEGLWKASLRTSERVDAQEVCSSLGGGGHTRAAGCTLRGTADIVKKAVLRELAKQLTADGD